MNQTIATLALFIGANVRRERTRRNISQEILAEKIDRTTQYISLLENGYRCGSIATYLSIANEFDLHLYELFINTKEDTKHLDDERRILELFCDTSPFERRVMIAILAAAKIALHSDN